MKKNIIFGICLFVIIAILVAAKTISYNQKIYDIYDFYFTVYGGMDPDSYIRYQYRNGYVIYENGYNSDNKIQEKITESFKNELIDILNKYKILSWNGYDKSDNNILDGSAFLLEIKYNGKKPMKAHGYMKYPKNYSEFSKEIVDLYNKYGYTSKSDNKRGY